MLQLTLSPQEPGGKFESEEKIKDNQCDIIRLFVAHGAQLSAKDISGATAKDLANDNDFFEGVDLISECEGRRADDITNHTPIC